jgi:2,4-dienoyl-CoA reductase-like NADH-dependent reductase (Old Yellow Enzyme family)
MSLLFSPVKLGNIELKNRFIRSATTSYWADTQGILRQEIINLYQQLAEGDIGLLIKGHLYVTDSGKAHEGMAGISQDSHLPQLQKLTTVVHNVGGTIIAQLNHAGIHSIIDRAGPSRYQGNNWLARPFSTEEIAYIIEAFGAAAERAIIAGFDGIQIHGAHGYLLSQFLSQDVNTRRDQWGGSLQNRMRLLRAVYHAIRGKIGRRPLLLKLNCDDFSPHGFTINESLTVAETLCQAGLDALELSGGGIGRQPVLRQRVESSDPALGEAAFAGAAQKIRQVTHSTPLALVNGIRSLDCMNALIQKDIVDMISMSRPFIKEPNLVKQLHAGQQASTCPSCSACSAPDVFGKMMLRCHLDKPKNY